jgi:hypothetical protein
MSRVSFRRVLPKKWGFVTGKKRFSADRIVVVLKEVDVDVAVVKRVGEKVSPGDEPARGIANRSRRATKAASGREREPEKVGRCVPGEPET